MLQMSTALILRREALNVKKINPHDHEISHIHLSLNIDLKEKMSLELEGSCVPFGHRVGRIILKYIFVMDIICQLLGNIYQLKLYI